MNKTINKPASFHGIYIPLITPFSKHDESLDLQATDALIEFLIINNVHGLYVGGSTGEALMQSLEERSAFLKHVAYVAKGRLQLIAHVGSLATKDAIHLAEVAAASGYDATSSTPPFYYKFSRSEVIRYYEDLVAATPLPFFIYNAPGNTSFEFSLDDLCSLLGNDSIVGLKHTQTDFFIIERLKARLPEAIVFNGPDEMLIAGLTMGCDGGIGSTYNAIPEKYVGIYDAYRQGDLQRAIQLQHEANALTQLFLEVGLYNGIRHFLKLRGVDTGISRRPFAALSTEGCMKLDAFYQEHFHDND
jgi:N-acetylneuraminate lyase